MGVSQRRFLRKKIYKKEKMILILSEEKDLTTHEVVDWLNYYNAPFVRINTENLAFQNFEVSTNSIVPDNYSLQINNQKIELVDVKAYWYRRGNFCLEKNNTYPIGDINVKRALNNFSYQEISKNTQLIHHILANKKGINKHQDNEINKFETLIRAKKIGLLIPPSGIFTKKDSLEKFVNNHQEVVVKAISNGFTFINEDYWINSYTEILDSIKLAKIPNTFFPTFFQKHIIKKLDLRIFFLNNQFYSSAIFSQNDKQTAIDFRRYNDGNPNRVVPFNLPDEIKNKLSRLMKNLDMNSGSIDMIYSLNKEFIFLEVNPVGQFGQVSSPCNYYLEELMAKELIKIANNEN